MSNHRDTGKARLYADMQRLLATLMQRDISDPRLAGLCITRLEAVHGGQQVRIYVHKPDEVDQAVCMDRLELLTPHFAHELRRAMPKRRLPGLKFCWDESVEGAAGVNSILASLSYDHG